jgi:opacity protein-like surface antigen
MIIMYSRIFVYSRISLFVAAVTTCFAPLATAQVSGQTTVPILTPQQAWQATTLQNSTAPPVQPVAYGGQTAQVAAAAAGCDSCVGGCDARGGNCGNGGSCGAAGCNPCGGGYAAGGLVGRYCGRGFAGAAGAGCGSYDSWCPTRYFSVYGGATYFHDIDPNISVAAANLPVTTVERLDLNDGWGIGGAVGRSVGSRLRVELDFTYRNATVNTATLNVNGVSSGAIPVEGRANLYSIMPNLLLDLCPHGPLNAYIGVGAGVSFNDLQVFEAITPVSVELQDSSFAWQGIAGLSTNLGQNAELFFEYRYFATDELQIDAAAGPLGAASVDVDITSNNFFAGLRLKRW